MDMTLLIIMAVALFGVLVFVLAKALRRSSRAPADYLTFFIMGISLMAIGISTENHVFSAMGLIFAAVSLNHRDKWKRNHRGWNQLSAGQKRVKITFLIILGLFALAWIVIFLLSGRSCV